jgi:phenylacetate-CoA ligase
MAGYRSYRHRFGTPFHRALRECRDRDRDRANEVREEQERRLREIVRWVGSTVPYYRDLFRREGIDPDTIRSLDDLSKIPTLDKHTVQSRKSELVSESIPRRAQIAGRTSGTTGTALSLVYTHDALAWQYAAVWRQRGWWRMALGDKYAAFGGQRVVPVEQRMPPYWRHDPARSRALFSLYHMAPQNMRHYTRELMRPGYLFWQGYPSSIALVARYLLDWSLDLGRAAPDAVFTSSETLLEPQRNAIEKSTGAAVADHYSNAELCVSVSQCPELGYHVDTELCALEVDPHEETDDWVRGEIIATGFANRAMPLLRYRTGDVATLLKRGACPCGRGRPLLERIDGRIEDYIITPDGRRVGRMDHIFKDTLEVKEAQLYQPSVEQLIVRIVPGSGWGLDVERYLDHELRSRIGPGLATSYELHDSLPRAENGKFRAVISSVKEGQLL